MGFFLAFLFFAVPKTFSQYEDGGTDSLYSPIPPSIAILFPLNIPDPMILESIENTCTNIHAFDAILAKALEFPQVASNGSPFPEASSLAIFTLESFRAHIKSSSISLVDIDTLKADFAASEGIDTWNAPCMQSVDVKYFTLYSIVDSQIRIKAIFIDQNNELIQFDSKWAPIFDITVIINDAIEYFIHKNILIPIEAEKNNSQVHEADQALYVALPTIPSWSNLAKYNHAKEGLNFSLGGLAIGLSTSFVSVGIWQMYREAEFRNGAFAQSTSISGLVAGVSIAITSAFLITSISNIVSILTYSP